MCQARNGPFLIINSSIVSTVGFPQHFQSCSVNDIIWTFEWEWNDSIWQTRSAWLTRTTTLLSPLSLNKCVRRRNELWLSHWWIELTSFQPRSCASSFLLPYIFMGQGFYFVCPWFNWIRIKCSVPLLFNSIDGCFL